MSELGNQSSGAGTIRFGPFELDLDARELRQRRSTGPWVPSGRPGAPSTTGCSSGTLARFCAVASRFDEAAEWFARGGGLDEQGARPLRAALG